MAFLPQVYTIPQMVSGSSQTSMLTLAGNFLYVYLQVPTMTGGYAADTKIMLQVSGDGSTFYRFSNPENNTNTVGTNDFQIVSSATQRMICVNNFCFPYLKVETTAVATAGVANNNPFKLICVSNQ